MTKQTKTKAKPQPKATTPVEAPKRETKQEIIINLLKREQGATLDELIKATEWKPHSVRGHLSNLRKKQGLDIQPSFAEDGTRSYRIIEPQAAA
jgi:predicted ArsR family transcriptional regulator